MVISEHEVEEIQEKFHQIVEYIKNHYGDKVHCWDDRNLVIDHKGCVLDVRLQKVGRTNKSRIRYSSLCISNKDIIIMESKFHSWDIFLAKIISSMESEIKKGVKHLLGIEKEKKINEIFKIQVVGIAKRILGEDVVISESPVGFRIKRKEGLLRVRKTTKTSEYCEVYGDLILTKKQYERWLEFVKSLDT